MSLPPSAGNGHPVLITGASSGIGAAFARRLAARGHPLWLVARRQGRLDELAAALGRGVEVRPLVADLSTDEGVERIEREILQGPALEMLINNAGFGSRGHFVAVDAQRVLAQTRLHVLAPVRLVRTALPAMVARGRGAVINVSSLAAFFTKSHYVSYSASKAYLNMFTHGLAAELVGTGLRAQVLCPGLTRTEFLEAEDYRDCDLHRVPRWAWMSPDAVVEESLGALEGGATVVIPGRANRLFIRAMHTPLVGRLLRAGLDRTGLDW